jgi:hypothetical protein
MALAKFAYPFPNDNMPSRQIYTIDRTGAKIKMTASFFYLSPWEKRWFKTVSPNYGRVSWKKI